MAPTKRPITDMSDRRGQHDGSEAFALIKRTITDMSDRSGYMKLNYIAIVKGN